MTTGGTWYGVDVAAESITDNLKAFVWEPALVKINMLSSAAEAACLILSIDETIKNVQSEQAKMGQAGNPAGNRGRRNRVG